MKTSKNKHTHNKKEKQPKAKLTKKLYHINIKFNHIEKRNNYLNSTLYQIRAYPSVLGLIKVSLSISSIKGCSFLYGNFLSLTKQVIINPIVANPAPMR